MPGISSTSTRRAAASTAVAGQATVINSGTAFTVTGTIVTSNTTINLGVVTPGENSSSSTVTVSGGPSIANVQYLDANNTVVAGQIAVNTTGGNILINGSNFVANSSVYVNNTLVTNTFISTSQIRAIVPSGSVGNVSLMIFAPTNSGAMGPAVRYSGAPSWTTTAAGSNNGAAASIQLVATGDSALTYTLGAGSLPTGLTLSSSGLISGTVSGYTNTTVVTFTVIATDQEGQQTQQVINYTVQVGDTFISYVPLILSAATPTANTFVADASVNNTVLTILGDTQPSNRTPFASNPGTYGSAYFDGTGDYLTSPSSAALAFGTGDFTVEMWVYSQDVSVSSQRGVLQISDTAGGLKTTYTTGMICYFGGTGNGSINIIVGGTAYDSAAGIVSPNTWNHVAVTRSSGTVRLWLNGTSVASGTGNNTNLTGTYIAIGGYYSTSYLLTGYMSNLRIVKGTALYTSTFTPSTTPLTAVSGTSLLTLQTNQPTNNNRFLDSSATNSIITRNGNATQGTFTPFGESWSYYLNGSGTTTTLPTVRTPTSSNYVFYGSSGTVEAWVYLTGYSTGALPQGGSILYSVHWGSGERYNALAINGNGYFYIIKDGGGYIDNTSTTLIPLYTWTHIAWTYNGSANKFYVNGVDITSQFSNPTLSGQFPFNTTGTPFVTIGSTFYNGSSWTYLSPLIGYVSNLRVVKGSVLYTGNFTPSTTPLQPVTGTALLTGQSNRYVDNSTNNQSLTVIGNATVRDFSPFVGITLPTPYYSAYFDGSGDSLSVPTSTALQFSTGSFTIEFWFNTSSSTTYASFVSNEATNVGFTILINNGSANGVIAIYNGSAGLVHSTSASYRDGAWHHLAWCRDGTSARLYIDGVLVSTNVSQATFSMDAGSTWYIGNNGLFAGRDYLGCISNFRVVKGTAVYTSNFTPSTTPLTAISNTSLLTCQSNTFIDASSNNFTITAGGNVVPSVVSPFTPQYSVKQNYSTTVIGGAAYFDGNGDYLTAPDNADLELGSSNFTVECWIYPTSLKGYQAIASKPGGSDAYGWVLVFETNNSLSFYSGNGSWTIIMTGAGFPAANSWSHVAVTRSGNVWRMFLNGVQVNTVTNAFTIDDLAYPMYVGWYPNFPGSNSAQSFSGYISNFRVVKGTALYTSNFVPQNRPLTAVTNTTLLLSGTSAAIYDSVSQNIFESVGDARILSGSTTPATPYYNTYYSNFFDGTGDFISGSNGGSLGAGDFTIEAWVNVSAWSTYGAIIENTNTGRYQLGFTGTNQIVFYSGSSIATTSAGTAPLNQWLHIAVCRSGSGVNNISIWINGANRVQGTSTANFSDDGLRIGTSFDNYGITGYVSNLRIVKGTAVYNTATFTPPTAPLTAISGTSLLTCQRNRINDNSTNNISLTSNGDTAVRSFNPFQNNPAGSIYFDGTGDYLRTPSTVEINRVWWGKSFTLEYWIYANTLNQEVVNTTPVVIGNMDPTGGTCYWAFGPMANGTVRWYYWNGSAQSINTSAVIAARQWHHLAFVNNNGSLAIYINGVSSATGTVAGTPQSSAAFPISIGAVNNTYFNGYLADLRITAGVARYTAGFTPPTSPLLTQ